MTLEGKLAVVTGGGAGIGRAICQRLGGDGARGAVLDIRQETADQTLELIGGAGGAFVCDVSDSSSVDEAFARIESELGPPDVLVNNGRAIVIEHVRRIKPMEAKQREEAAAGKVTTPLDAL